MSFFEVLAAVLAIAAAVLLPRLSGPFGSINVAFYISANDVSSARLLRSIACLSLFVPYSIFIHVSVCIHLLHLPPLWFLAHLHVCSVVSMSNVAFSYICTRS